MRYRFTRDQMQALDPPKPTRDCDGRDEHVHIHLYDANAGAAGEGGSAGGLPAARSAQKVAPSSAGFGDQEEEPTGQLLCRLMQQGEDWRAVDGEGNELTVSHGGDGALEIRTIHHPDNETGDGDPEKLGITRPPASAAHDSDAAALRRFQRDGRARHPSTEYAANRERARLISEYYQQQKSGR